MTAPKHGFRGSFNLKRIRTQHEFTPFQISELKKCAADPIYFSETYMKVVHVDRGLETIQLYDYQKEIVSSVHNNRATVVECARQAGKTTSLVAVILHYTIFNDFKKVAILANKEKTAKQILARIKLAYEHLPPWIQQGIVSWGKEDIELENGSTVVAAATSSDNIRGEAVNLLFIDEAAWVQGWNEFFTSVYPTISSGVTTKICLVSTVNGLNHFHRITSLARKKQNDYNLISVKWDAVPGRDEAWKQKTLADLSFDHEKFAQEYENEYLGSSGTLISGSKLKQLTAATELPMQDHAGVKMYQPYIKGHEYVLIADVARGKGLDYSAFIIVDISKMPYRQVLVFRDNRATPREFTEIIHRFSKMYGFAYTLIEINDIGQQVADLLYYDFECDNLLFTNNVGAKGKVITTGMLKTTDKGIRTTKTVKNIGCSIMKLLIEQDQLIVNDHETIYELSTFSRKAQTYQAEPGKHDDLAMCLVLFAWLSEQQYFKQLTDINTLMTIRDKTEAEMEEDLLPFGFVSTGIEDFQVDIELEQHTDENWVLVR